MIQKPLFSPQVEWTPPEEFKDLSKYDEIAIDLETKDPELKTMGSGSVTGRGRIVGIALAVEDWSGYYPIAHEGGGNMDEKKVMDYFRTVLNYPSRKIFHNAMYDVCFIRAAGLQIAGDIVDTMIAGSLVDENRFRYDLGSMGRDYLGKGKNEAILTETAREWGVDAKSEMYKLPAMYVGEYAERDAEMTLELWQEMKKEIYAQDIEDIFKLETELFPCLVDMRFLGVRVDRTEKTNSPSFTKNFLQNHPNPVVKHIARAREINKAHTTFIDTILKHSHNGRIHAEINQLRSDSGGTVTGRFSYANPNLQQIPARNKELGPKIRSLFIPEEGCKWGVFDYSQQEPRLVVHYAAIQNMYAAGDVLDAYKDGDADFHQIVADMAEIPRDQAKTINLGLFYGMGKNKLQAELGVNKERAEELFKQYHARVPFVKQLMDSVMARAQDRGKVRTLLGRLCRFHLWEPNQFGIHKALPHEAALAEHGPGIKRAYTYKALNRLIQGSAADMTKKAMIDLHKEGITPHIQVHDELDISVSDNADKIKDIMESAVQLEVPNKVDYESGPNWGTIK
jgi:DNA polymerase I-like protein with 3'-5' exonuclease and polymerase domains